MEGNAKTLREHFASSRNPERPKKVAEALVKAIQNRMKEIDKIHEKLDKLRYLKHGNNDELDHTAGALYTTKKKKEEGQLEEDVVGSAVMMLAHTSR